MSILNLITFIAFIVSMEPIIISQGIYGSEFACGYTFQTLKEAPIHVKSDGSGDFKEIQEAINSISDASPEKPYVIYVHDDQKITDISDLYYVSSRKRVDNPRSINDHVAAIIPSHWIRIVGFGSPRTIEIVSPKDLPVNVYQYIQVAYPMGNCILENLRLIITGGRYAIHQESGGMKNHRDYWATTVYRNIYAEHKGNVGYPKGVWTSVYAQANGTTSGTRMVFLNCEWRGNNYAPFYTHSNMSFDQGNVMIFDNCKMHLNGLSDVRWSDLGSGWKSHVVIQNCDFGFFTVGNSIRGQEHALTIANNWRDGGAEVCGSGNTVMTAIEDQPSTLYFEAANAGESIRVVGGDAAPLIIGGELKAHEATVDRPGAFWANRRIQQTSDGLGKSRVFTLQHRLGNCGGAPKALLIEVGDEKISITFNKNYVTADGGSYGWDTEPVVSTQQVLDDINRLARGRFTCSMNKLMRISSFKDCMVSVQNKTDCTFDLGNALVRDYAAGWACYRLARPGERPDAIAGTRIPVHSSMLSSDFDGIMFNRAIFRASSLGLSNLKSGAMIKCIGRGAFQLADGTKEGVMFALDSQYVQAAP